MNKRYIDFVPKKSAANPARPRVTLPDGSAARVTTRVATERRVEEQDIELADIFEERPSSRPADFGVIENFSDKFVSTAVEKRPLSTAEDAKAAKSKKIPRIPLISKSKKETKSNPSSLPESKAPTADKMDKMKIPVHPFINAEKVDKRPLSRNVYQPRKIPVIPKEEPKGTVTIIEKPEKDSRIGLIVTIIITIILGAAAGTVAFLLLPK